jgi:hypothetical protein
MGAGAVSLKARKTGQLASAGYITWPMPFHILCIILELRLQRIGRKAMSENNGERSSKNTVTITLIIVVGVIIFTCILAFTAVSVAALLNMPW